MKRTVLTLDRDGKPKPETLLSELQIKPFGNLWLTTSRLRYSHKEVVSVTEPITGAEIAWDFTEEKAIAKARRILRYQGVRRFRVRIKEVSAKFGVLNQEVPNGR